MSKLEALAQVGCTCKTAEPQTSGHRQQRGSGKGAQVEVGALAWGLVPFFGSFQIMTKFFSHIVKSYRLLLWVQQQKMESSEWICLAQWDCSSYISVADMKPWPNPTWERKGFMWLTSPSLREARKGAQGRNLEAETEAGTTEACCLLASSVCFLRQPRPTTRVALWAAGWPVASLMEAIPPATQVLSSQVTSFCQVHRNQSAQRCFRIINWPPTNKALDTPVKIPHYSILQFK